MLLFEVNLPPYHYPIRLSLSSILMGEFPFIGKLVSSFKFLHFFASIYQVSTTLDNPEIYGNLRTVTLYNFFLSLF